MARAVLLCFGFAILVFGIDAASRVERSPQYGSYSQSRSEASSQSGSFSGPQPYPPQPYQNGYQNPGLLNPLGIGIGANVLGIGLGARVRRSPQQGAFGQASAQASSQAFGGGGGYPNGPPLGNFGIQPHFRRQQGIDLGPRLFGRNGGRFEGPGNGGRFSGPVNGGGLGANGGTISISKSISISRGGTAQSSASSNASGK